MINKDKIYKVRIIYREDLQKSNSYTDVETFILSFNLLGISLIIANDNNLAIKILGVHHAILNEMLYIYYYKNARRITILRVLYGLRENPKR